MAMDQGSSATGLAVSVQGQHGNRRRNKGCPVAPTGQPWATQAAFGARSFSLGTMAKPFEPGRNPACKHGNNAK